MRERDDSWTYYPAIMADTPEYRITEDIVTAINMSWSSTTFPALESLTSLPPVQVGDALCDFQAFAYLVKKFTGNLWQHNFGLPDTAPDPREQLLALSDVQRDMTIIAAFYNKARIEFSDRMRDLARVIPDNVEGNQLTQTLFSCDVNDLYATPHRVCVVPPSSYDAHETITTRKPR